MGRLEKLLPELLKDLNLKADALKIEAEGRVLLPLEDGVAVSISESPAGITFKASLAAYPRERLEQFFMHALDANLFGMGTDGAILGISPDDKSFSLSRHLHHPLDYKLFRETLDNFINAVDFWREEIFNHK
jgi:hypothetical protein